MHVTMLTLGSRGDVEPLLAFALRLERAGHRVCLATYPRLEPLVTQPGVEFAPLAEGALSLGGQTAAGRRWVESGHSRQPTWVGLIRDARSVARRRLADASAACEGADVIVANNLAQVLGWQMADRFGVPLVRVLFHAPTYWLARRRARPVTSTVRQVAWLAARPWLNRVRRQSLGLRRLPLREPMSGLDRREMPVLYPFSPAVFPTPAGMSKAAAVTGYWFSDERLDPEPPAALLRFLEAGPSPVYIGFGTQLDPDPQRTTTILVSALRLAGRRGVLLRAPEALGTEELGDDIFALQAISHHWLFQRCAAVVHHSASGTTAAGLRAGIPAVTVPHNSDQYSWATRVHELGVAPAPIPRRELSTEALAAAITAATTDEATRLRAAALGQRIRSENGVETAAAHFERWVIPAARRTRPVPASSSSIPTRSLP